MKPSKKQIVAAYVRTSGLSQESGSDSQRRAIEQWLQGNGYEPSQVRWYVDKISGKSMDRPAWKKLQKDIFMGEVKVICVWKLDRLSRSLKDGINTLCDLLEKGVRIVAISQQLDFSGQTGKLVASVLFAVAEMERTNIRENTIRGLENAVAKGKTLGRPKKTDLHELVISMRVKGMTLGEISKEIGLSRQRISVIVNHQKKISKANSL